MMTIIHNVRAVCLRQFGTIALIWISGHELVLESKWLSLRK